MQGAGRTAENIVNTINRSDGPSVLPSDNPLAKTCFDLESIKECYCKYGLWTKDKGKRTTFLHIAARYGSLVDVKYLMIERSVNVNIRDENNYAPLHNAVAHYCYDVVKFLINNGATVNVSGMDGYTPLHLAATNGDLFMYKFLKEKGGDPYTENVDGETPHRILEKFYESVQKTGNNVQETEQHSRGGDRCICVSGFMFNKKQASKGVQETENNAQFEYGEIKQEAASYYQNNGKKSKQTRRKENVKNKTVQSGKNLQLAGGTAENIVNTINQSDHECVGLDKKEDVEIKKASKRGNSAFVSRKQKCCKMDKDVGLPGRRKKKEKKKTYQVCERYGDTEERSMPDAEFWSKCNALSEEETYRPNSSNEQKSINMLKKIPKLKKVSATVSSADDALDSGMPVDEKNQIKSDCIATELLSNFKALETEDNTQGKEKNTIVTLGKKP